MNAKLNNGGFTKALVDCGLLSKSDKRLVKLDTIDRLDFILHFHKLGVSLEDTIDLVYELKEYEKDDRDRFLKELDEVLKNYKKYMVNYDINGLIKEVISYIKSKLSLKDIIFKIKTLNNNDCIMRLKGVYFRVKRENQEILLVNEANNRLYMRANGLVIKQDELKKLDEADIDYDILLK